MHAIVYEDPTLGPCIVSVRNIKEAGVSITEIVIPERQRQMRPYKLPKVEFYEDDKLVKTHYGIIDIATVKHIVSVYGKK